MGTSNREGKLFHCSPSSISKMMRVQALVQFQVDPPATEMELVSPAANALAKVEKLRAIAHQGLVYAVSLCMIPLLTPQSATMTHIFRTLIILALMMKLLRSPIPSTSVPVIFAGCVLILRPSKTLDQP